MATITCGCASRASAYYQQRFIRTNSTLDLPTLVLLTRVRCAYVAQQNCWDSSRTLIVITGMTLLQSGVDVSYARQVVCLPHLLAKTLALPSAEKTEVSHTPPST